MKSGPGCSYDAGSVKDEGYLRLFVGVYPPAWVAEKLLNAAASIEAPKGRVTALEMVHVTLLFMGQGPARGA